MDKDKVEGFIKRLRDISNELGDNLGKATDSELEHLDAATDSIHDAIEELEDMISEA